MGLDVRGPGGNPQTVVIDNNYYNTIVQGTWAHRDLLGTWYNLFTNEASDTSGDEVQYKFGVGSGSYKLWFTGWKSSPMGITKVYVDGVLKITKDFYTGGASSMITETVTGLALGAGLHTINVKVDGKNAAATNHYCIFSNIVLTPE